MYVSAAGAKRYQSTMDAPKVPEHCCVYGFVRLRGLWSGCWYRWWMTTICTRIVARLTQEFGFASRAFSSAEAFLSSDCVNETKCLVLDVSMPGMAGPTSIGN